MKIYHCGYCGEQLELYRKAIPGKGIILNLIAPHDCGGKVPFTKFETAPAPTRTKEDVDELFNSFPFVDKINKDESSQPLPIPDSRAKEHKRKELNSTAPPNLIEMARRSSTRPISGRELEVPDGDEE